MISIALENIKSYLKNKFEEAGHPDWEVILDAIDKEGPKEDGLYITLLRIEEESSIKKQSRLVQRTETDGKNVASHYANPDLCLNLYILISAFAQDYSTGLMQISSTMRLLNNIQDFKYVGVDEITKMKMIEQEEKELEAKAKVKTKVYNSIRNLSIELQHLTAEQTNNLWQTLGSKVMPAVCYKVRMLTLSAVDNNDRLNVVKEIILKPKVTIDT